MQRTPVPKRRRLISHCPVVKGAVCFSLVSLRTTRLRLAMTHRVNSIKDSLGYWRVYCPEHHTDTLMHVIYGLFVNTIRSATCIDGDKARLAGDIRRTEILTCVR